MPSIMSKTKPSACRRLQFDDDDEDTPDRNNAQINNHSSIEETSDQNYANACLEELRRRNREESALRWNFDFETETPLPGPYVWERVEPEIAPTLVEARVTTIETQQNEQNDLTEAMDCDVAATSAAITPNESSERDTLEMEQMVTPSKSSQ